MWLLWEAGVGGGGSRPRGCWGWRQWRRQGRGTMVCEDGWAGALVSAWAEGATLQGQEEPCQAGQTSWGGKAQWKRGTREDTPWR